MDSIPSTDQRDTAEAGDYLEVTSAERDWLLSGAVGYFRDLELARAPGERIAAKGDSQPGFLRFLEERRFKQRIDRCLINLQKTEDPEIKLDRARSLGLGGSDDLVCLAALQFVFAIQCRCRRLGRTEDPPDDQLWAALKDIVEFCHTRAYALVAMYEEHHRRDPINRQTARDPAESYATWRGRAARLVTEMRPVSVQFVRQEATDMVWREDRTAFQRRWLDKQIAEAWKYGGRPYHE